MILFGFHMNAQRTKMHSTRTPRAHQQFWTTHQPDQQQSTAVFSAPYAPKPTSLQLNVEEISRIPSRTGKDPIPTEHVTLIVFFPGQMAHLTGATTEEVKRRLCKRRPLFVLRVWTYQRRSRVIRALYTVCNLWVLDFRNHRPGTLWDRLYIPSRPEQVYTLDVWAKDTAITI